MQIAAFVLIFGFLASCSQAPKDYSIQKINPKNLRVRRPLTEGADPKSNPGGEDYHSEVTACQKIETLFSEMKLSAIRECLGSVKKPLNVLFRLKREPAPYLFLDEAKEDFPICLTQTLGKILVPREIIFDSTDLNRKGERECYVSRLDVEANELLGMRLPSDRLAVRVDFPLKRIPKTDAETLRLLSTWALTVFRDPFTGHWDAKFLSGTLCNQCIGVRTDDPNPIFWP